MTRKEAAARLTVGALGLGGARFLLVPGLGAIPGAGGRVPDSPAADPTTASAGAAEAREFRAWVRAQLAERPIYHDTREGLDAIVADLRAYVEERMQ